MGGVLGQLGLRAIPLGIAAMVLGFALKSAGTQAGPADTLPSLRVSVFGTIHPEIFRLSAPLGSGAAGDRVRLASLEPQVGLFDAPAKAANLLTDTSGVGCRNAPFDDRFATLGDGPASFDKRFTSADDCPASFDESLASAMRVLADSLRVPPDREIEKKRADGPPKLSVFKAHVGLPQARKEVPPLEHDGRTAIYDITARTVYLPSGRRLEAHSGFGDLMDNPRHVHVRMQGATPPNVYDLTLRERLFHGVRAIRLNPVDGSKMYGRAGILAHPYMLGANGQSNGCVSFSDYPEFLNAFLRAEVTRLVVVERLESPPGKFAAGQLPDRGRDELKADRSFQYAAASY
jgi:type VI secretion system (T6SS) effector TldE1-like protein